MKSVLTWNTVPSSSVKAFTACSGIINVMKANPFTFFVRLSTGRFTSVKGPKTQNVYLEYAMLVRLGND